MADNHWINADGGNWSTGANWSLGHTTDATESALFDCAFNASKTVTVDVNSTCLHMNWTGATGTPTLALGAQELRPCGNVIFIAAMAVTSAGDNFGYIKWYADGSLTSNGLVPVVNISNQGYIVSLNDAVNVGTSRRIWNYNGTFVTNGFTVTCGIFGWGDGVATITPSSSTINCTSISVGAGTATLTANTATINCSGNFTGGSLTTYNTVNLTGATSTITGNNQIKTLGLTRADVQTITFTDATTQAISYLTRDAGTSLKTLAGSGNGGWKLVKLGGAPVNIDYISVSKSKVFPPQTWFAGTHSINGGNNVGWNFGIKAHRSDAMVC